MSVAKDIRCYPNAVAIKNIVLVDMYSKCHRMSRLHEEEHLILVNLLLPKIMKLHQKDPAAHHIFNSLLVV